jgi:hypothetical protein
MQAMIIGPVLFSSFVAAYIIEKRALEALLRIMDTGISQKAAASVTCDGLQSVLLRFRDTNSSNSRTVKENSSESELERHPLRPGRAEVRDVLRYPNLRAAGNRAF